MVVARIEFRQEHASHFILPEADGSQRVFSEATFDSPEELVNALKEFEYAIKDCVALVNGRVICLSGFKAK